MYTIFIIVVLLRLLKPIEIRNNSTFNDLTARNDDVTVGGTSSYDTIRYNDNLYNLGRITGTTTGLWQFDLYSGRTRNCRI